MSPDEIEVVRWLLANGAMKDLSEYRFDSLDEARVVPDCPCGCASISFLPRDPREIETREPPLRASNIIAEAFILWPDGSRTGIMLWGAEGRLLSVELYDMSGGPMNRFPAVDSLRRWEDFYGPDE